MSPGSSTTLVRSVLLYLGKRMRSGAVKSTCVSRSSAKAPGARTSPKMVIELVREEMEAHLKEFQNALEEQEGENAGKE